MMIEIISNLGLLLSKWFIVIILIVIAYKMFIKDIKTFFNDLRNLFKK